MKMPGATKETRAKRVLRAGGAACRSALLTVVLATCSDPPDPPSALRTAGSRVVIRLVSPTGIRLEPRNPTSEQSERIARADSLLEAAPDDPNRLVEAAQALEDVWRYPEAIALYTRGMRLAPDDYRMVLGRAHRLIRLRQFDAALEDLDRSKQLDPFGFNTAYLRGLTYYLLGRFDAAADEFARCMDMASDSAALELATRVGPAGDPRSCFVIPEDPSSYVAIASWRYRALRRAGRHDEAARLLIAVPDDLALSDSPGQAYPGSLILPGSNRHYYRLLLFFRGSFDEESVLDRDWAGEQWSTLAYGVAVWHLVDGNPARAIELLRQILAEPHWARFGHVAAETDLIRLGAISPVR